MRKLALNLSAFAVIIAGATRLHANVEPYPKLICCAPTFGDGCCGYTRCSAGLWSCAAI